MIYKALYWNKITRGRFPCRTWRTSSAISIVNSGTHATKLLQQVLNGMGAHLVEDGTIGPGTVKTLAGLDQVQVYRKYKQGRIAYYQALGQRFPQFVKGWLNRVNAFPDL